jgi:hypothetical protein
MLNRCDVVKNGVAAASKSAKEKMLRPSEVLRIFMHNHMSRYFIFYRPMNLCESVRYMNKYTYTDASLEKNWSLPYYSNIIYRKFCTIHNT